MPAVEVDNLSVLFRPPGRRRAGLRRPVRRPGLLDVSLTVESGELLGVVGSNGSGKTTLLQSVAGVLRPSSGAVRCQGRVLSMIDLTAGFHRDLNGEENLRVQAGLLGLGRDELRSKHAEVLEFAGLPPEVLDAPFRTYSAGMGLRLGFALVACARPDVLLVDEVLAVGDQAFGERCLAWMSARREQGMAVLLVTHDLDLVRKHADRLLVLDGGTSRYLGDVAAGLDLYDGLTLSGGATQW